MKLKEIKVTFVILVISFLISLYVIGSRYLQYRTVTNVKAVIHKNELPEILESFCVMPSEEWRDVKLTVTMNGIEVKFGNSYNTLNTVCWEIQYERNASEYIDTQYFEIKSNSTTLGFAGISKYLRKEGSREIAVVNGFSRHEFRDSITMFHVQLLPSPYDTNCFTHKVSQENSVADCSSSMVDEYEYYRKLVCSKLYAKQNCQRLVFQYTFQYERSETPTLIYGNNVFSLRRTVAIPFVLFMQQVVGLVTMFFDLSAQDVKPIFKFLRRKRTLDEKSIGRLFRHSLRWMRRSLRNLCSLLIFLAFVWHLKFCIMSYMEYETSSETFFGRSKEVIAPIVKVCSFGEVVRDQYVNISVLGTRLRTFAYLNTSCIEITTVSDVRSTELPLVSVRVNRGMIRMNVGYTTPVPWLTHNIVSYRITAEMKYKMQSVHKSLLPAPYWTKCINYRALPWSSSIHCYESCVMETLSPTHSAMQDTYEMDFLTRVGSNNPCRHKCRHRDCEFRQSYVTDGSGELSEIQRIELFMRTLLSIRLYPNQNWTDFFTYTASLFSLWLGLSMMDVTSMLRYISFQQFVAHIRLHRLILRCLLVSLCTLQMYYLVHGYLVYEITSNVYIGTPDAFTLPAFSIIYDRFPINLSVTDDLTLSPFEVNKRYPASTGVQRVAIMDPRSFKHSNIEYRKWGKLISSMIITRYKILTLSFNNLDPDYYKYIYVIGTRGILINISHVDRPFFEDDNRFVMMHGSKDDITTLLESSKIDGSKEYVSCKIFETQLLKAPYSSKCIDYKEDPFNECLKYRHFNLHSKHPNNIPISASSNISRMEPDEKILSKCSEQFSTVKKCIEISYKVQPFQKKWFGNNLIIGKPTHITSFKFYPKTSLFDLIVLIFDAMGLWLGISIGLILEKSNRYVKKRFARWKDKKKKERKRNKNYNQDSNNTQN